MKLISVVTPCFNEEENVDEIYRQVKAVFGKLPDYQYEHIFIDNCSKDRTVEKLKAIASVDKAVKIIVNSRNFGWIRSPNYVIQQAYGDAVIQIVADLQDPPEMILDFVKHWEEGYKIVVGVKNKSEESAIMFNIRRFYYYLVSKLSDVELINNFTGYGLYDKCVIDEIRRMNDAYPYFRGLISEVGYEKKIIEYLQPVRRGGITSSNFYRMYDVAMLGIVNHSKVPLRFIIFFGLLLSAFCLLLIAANIVLKIIYWDSYPVGIISISIIVMFLFSVVFVFLGILAEYIGAIYTQVIKRPMVIEKERVNF
ncbi:MAG: dolichol-phosphate mannosyltransferase [Bacteroidota bacterium]|nr:dolichol-phosphate mannosyltransferase [Bacteroidota bacterium]